MYSPGQFGYSNPSGWQPSPLYSAIYQDAGPAMPVMMAPAPVSPVPTIGFSAAPAPMSGMMMMQGQASAPSFSGGSASNRMPVSCSPRQGLGGSWSGGPSQGGARQPSPRQGPQSAQGGAGPSSFGLSTGQGPGTGPGSAFGPSPSWGAGGPSYGAPPGGGAGGPAYGASPGSPRDGPSFGQPAYGQPPGGPGGGPSFGQPAYGQPPGGPGGGPAYGMPSAGLGDGLAYGQPPGGPGGGQLNLAPPNGNSGYPSMEGVMLMGSQLTPEEGAGAWPSAGTAPLAVVAPVDMPAQPQQSAPLLVKQGELKDKVFRGKDGQAYAFREQKFEGGDDYAYEIITVPQRVVEGMAAAGEPLPGSSAMPHGYSSDMARAPSSNDVSSTVSPPATSGMPLMPSEAGPQGPPPRKDTQPHDEGDTADRELVWDSDKEEWSVQKGPAKDSDARSALGTEPPRRATTLGGKRDKRPHRPRETDGSAQTDPHKRHRRPRGALNTAVDSADSEHSSADSDLTGHTGHTRRGKLPMRHGVRHPSSRKSVPAPVQTGQTGQLARDTNEPTDVVLATPAQSGQTGQPVRDTNEPTDVVLAPPPGTSAGVQF